MDKLKYIIIFFLGYLIFRIVSRYYTTEGFSPSSSNVAIGDDSDNGKFILPITEDADNTVQTNGRGKRSCGYSVGNSIPMLQFLAL